MTNDNEANRFTERELDNIALVRRWVHEVWNERRVETMEELMSPDFVVHYENEEIRGINNWKERVFDVFTEAISDIRVEIEDIIASGEQVVTRWKARGVHSGEVLGVAPSGKMVEVSGMSWGRIVHGKIVENRNNWSLSYLIEQLLSEVKALRGLLPLCSFCKKIRDDKGYWEQVDVFIQKYSEADITHGICPECMKIHYPEAYNSIESDKE